MTRSDARKRTQGTNEQAGERGALLDAVLGRICNVSNLPDWMRPAALGRNMMPLADLVADAILASDWLQEELIYAHHEGFELGVAWADRDDRTNGAARAELAAKLARVEALADEWANSGWLYDAYLPAPEAASKLRDALNGDQP